MTRTEINQVIEQTKSLTEKVMALATTIQGLKSDISRTDSLINKFDNKQITWEEFMDAYYMKPDEKAEKEKLRGMTYNAKL